MDGRYTFNRLSIGHNFVIGQSVVIGQSLVTGQSLMMEIMMCDDDGNDENHETWKIENRET